MLRVIGQDDPATVYTRKAKINLAPLLCNKGELSAQLTEGIKQKNGGIFPISVLLTFLPGML